MRDSAVETGEPLVSAITIFLDAETFLREAIESVLAQTYANWELLLVDDGSTDGSTEIALGYARLYPQRIRYLEHEGHRNRGMSASRNLGIPHARGEYIALLDADDVWLPLKLERQVAILESDPESAMVYGATRVLAQLDGAARGRRPRPCARHRSARAHSVRASFASDSRRSPWPDGAGACFAAC